jgi:hypothetical protein
VKGEEMEKYLVYTENPDVADVDCFEVRAESADDAILKFRLEHFPGWDYGEITAEVDGER